MTESTTLPDSPQRLTSFRALGFFPADYATVQAGKVYASGAYWTTLRFPAFPAVVPMISLVAVIEIPFHANQADHQLKMGLLGPDDEAMGFRVEGTFRSAPKIEHKYGDPGTVPVAVPVHGLSFDRHGKYKFTLAVDGEPLARYPFDVIQIARISVPPAMPQQLPE